MLGGTGFPALLCSHFESTYLGPKPRDTHNRKMTSQPHFSVVAPKTLRNNLEYGQESTTSDNADSGKDRNSKRQRRFTLLSLKAEEVFGKIQHYF